MHKYSIVRVFDTSEDKILTFENKHKNSVDFIIMHCYTNPNSNETRSEGYEIT